MDARHTRAPATERPLGVVVIGRNEGERLVRCLASLAGAWPVVYVDSGSTDGSVERASASGAIVVALDMAQPFTAARARNAGLARLLDAASDCEFVQFVDGDCEIDRGWLAAGANTLRDCARAAAVAGRLRERRRDATIYNAMCDMEWDAPLGEVSACGGVAMMRVEALRQVGGFNASLIAGEEPELCVRLRRAGWTIVRIDAEMGLHDAAMTKFGQWWKRAVRCGHAYAEGAAMHGASAERHWVRETRRAWAWGLAGPVAALALAWPTRGLSLALIPAAYAWQILRVRGHMRRRGFAPRDAATYAIFCAIGKHAECLGMLRYWWGRLAGKRSTIIEHRGAPCESAGVSLGGGA